MQSAFAVYPHFKAEERYSPWGGHHVPANMPFAGVSAPPVGNPLQEQLLQQQQQQHMGLIRTRGSDGSTGQPNTPQTEAKADHAFNHLWQAAVAVAALSPNDSLETEEAGEEEDGEEPANKKRKVGAKGRKGAGRRDLDKLAKQEQRMLKNRESAARSRLRRQQHTAQLEQENEELRAQMELLNQQVEQLTSQLQDAEWQLQLAKVPANLPRASMTVSRTQQTAGLSALPAAPSLSLSLPPASSLMMPAVPLVGGAGPQDGLAGIGLGVEGFDFAYTSRRSSSYA